MIKLGISAIQSARTANRDSARLERAVQAAQEMYARREADNKACYMALAGIRNEIRAFGGVIPEAGMDVLNLFPPIDPGVLKSSIR
jgi:hypothetical protein